MNIRRSIIIICASARLITLSILFAGSVAIVFAAITFVKTARFNGMSIAQAASYNAPTFLAYSKIALAAAIILVIAELIQIFISHVRNSLSQVICYAAEAGLFAAVCIFSLVITPAMEKLLPTLSQNASDYEAFHKLHHWSQVSFSCLIVFALISLVAPLFKQE